MSATPTGMKAILLAEIRAAGDERSRSSVDAILAQVFDTVWDTYQAEGIRNPRLQYLYAKRQVIEFWRSGVWRDVDFDDDVSESLGQLSRNLDMMDKGLAGQIEALESAIGHIAGPRTGVMTTTATHAGLAGQPDPNNPGYRGDPRYRGSLIR